jgi:DNA-binding MarR family transcriptional regulator
MTKAEKMTALTQAVRAAFNRLKALSDDLHGDGEVTTAMRAVMETLSSAGPMTVPQIARTKGVTRQHIQMLADALVAAGLAAVKDNPAHRRSSLIALTEKGRRTFAKMAAREAPLIEELGWEFDAPELERATAVLSRLVRLIDERTKAETEA